MLFKHLKSCLFILLILICQLPTLAAAQPDTKVSAIPEKQKVIDGHAIFYNEMGQGETILLVHGLFANKEQWRFMLPLLAQQHYHVIAVDLPGYGKSLGYPVQDYDLKNQVTLLHDFMQSVGVQKFDIAGNSMGGAISALYAQKYPTEIISVAMIGSPLGVISPHPSETDKLFKQGLNPFVVTSAAELDQIFKLIFIHPPQLDPTTAQHIAQKGLAEKAEREKITRMVLQYRELFEKPLTINAPMLIVWGDQDKIFDISGAQKLRDKFPKSSLVVLAQMGHMPHLECYVTTSHVYENFLANVKKSVSAPVPVQKMPCELLIAA